MRKTLGYTGPADPTQAQLNHWLTNTNSYQKNDAWDFYCQSILGRSDTSCAANPFTSNSNIYADPFSALAKQIYGHVYIQGTFCPLITCVSLTFQGGHMWLSFTPISLTKIFVRKPSVFAGLSIGINGATAEQEIRDNATLGGGLADGWGGGGGVTWYDPGQGHNIQTFYPYAYGTFGAGWVAQGSQVKSWEWF